MSGPISADTTWALAQSPFEVTADLSVVNGATLTIEAGAVVYFDAGTNLIVSNGALNARGTAGQPITFTSVLDTPAGAPAPGNWGRIQFLSGSSGAAIMEYAQVRYGQGIAVHGSSPTFNYLHILHNLGSAISVDLNSSPKGIGNQATGNTLNGISVPSVGRTGAVTWGIKNFPYVVSSGVAVGTSPIVTPGVQQSLAIDATILGSRLTGADSIDSLIPPKVSAFSATSAATMGMAARAMSRVAVTLASTLGGKESTATLTTVSGKKYVVPASALLSLQG